jgi:hypothetical protein
VLHHEIECLLAVYSCPARPLTRSRSLSVPRAKGRKMSEKSENVEGLKLSLSRDPLTPILSGYMWSLRLQCSGPYRVALALPARNFFSFSSLLIYLCSLNISPRKNSSKNDEGEVGKRRKKMLKRCRGCRGARANSTRVSGHRCHVTSESSESGRRRKQTFWLMS